MLLPCKHVPLLRLPPETVLSGVPLAPGGATKVNLRAGFGDELDVAGVDGVWGEAGSAES